MSPYSIVIHGDSVYGSFLDNSFFILSQTDIHSARKCSGQDALEQDGEARVLEQRMHLAQHVCGRIVLEVQRRKQADLAGSILEA